MTLLRLLAVRRWTAAAGLLIPLTITIAVIGPSRTLIPLRPTIVSPRLIAALMLRMAVPRTTIITE